MHPVPQLTSATPGLDTLLCPLVPAPQRAQPTAANPRCPGFPLLCSGQHVSAASPAHTPGKASAQLRPHVPFPASASVSTSGPWSSPLRCHPSFPPLGAQAPWTYLAEDGHPHRAGRRSRGVSAVRPQRLPAPAGTGVRLVEAPWTDARMLRPLGQRTWRRARSPCAHTPRAGSGCSQEGSRAWEEESGRPAGGGIQNQAASASCRRRLPESSAGLGGGPGCM